MQAIHIIGVGPGDPEYLTKDARSIIDAAEDIWCADRHSGLVPEEKVHPLVPFGAALESIRRAWMQGRRTAVLVSGDTGLYSMLGLLRDAFGTENIEVHPGISALQLFCARMHTAWQDVRILSAHGRKLTASALCHYVRTERRTILFLDAQQNPHWVADALKRGGLGTVRITIGERLGYPDESVAPYADRPYDPLCIAIIENDAAVAGLPHIGLPDDMFIRSKTPMTKQIVRVNILNALCLQPDSVVWDVGAGTGSVSVECAGQCPLGEVYAVEYKPDAIDLIRQNAAHFYRLNLHVIEGRAPECLVDLPKPDAVFLGGTEGCAPEVLEILHGFHAPVRVAATAVTMESAFQWVTLLKGEPEFSGMQLSVSHMEKLGRYDMLKAQNPVFLFSAMIGGRP